MYWVAPILGGICAALIYQLVWRAPPLAKTRNTQDGEYLEVMTGEKK